MIMLEGLRYAAPVMAFRNELKALIDQVPESRLESVRMMLEQHINPPKPHPRRCGKSAA